MCLLLRKVLSAYPTSSTIFFRTSTTADPSISILPDNFEYFDSDSSYDKAGSVNNDARDRQPKTQKTKNNPHGNRPSLA